MSRITHNITGSVLKHMTHAEDLVFFGKEGCDLLLDGLEDFYNYLSGKDHTSRITQKIDGAPALVMASDYYGQKFIALKHSWDKNKIYKNLAEIQEAYPDRPDLCEKLSMVFSALDIISIPQNEIWMCDFLYAKKDLKVKNIDGQDYLTFHPNTLLYAVPVESELAKKISRTEFGLAYHTKYIGQEKTISFDVNIDELQHVPNILQLDARLPEIRKTPDQSLTDDFRFLYSELEKAIDKLTSMPGYPELCQNSKAIALLHMFRNAEIRKGNEDLDSAGLYAWIQDRFEKEAETKKTENGKESTRARGQALLESLDKNLIDQLYLVQKLAVSIKEPLIQFQDDQATIKTFIERLDGTIEPASSEGLVSTDNYGNCQKLVNRLNFSKNNFSDTVRKGWSND